ncbi:MAG: GTP-binding protein [Opitutaceae bacterium]|nr:GTP-binding protein [Opitutaceae bacterium]
MSRILPVTLITGSLGAGKTTLLNRMVAGAPDLRTAIIENEFGDISVDDRFVIFTNEELVQAQTSSNLQTMRGDFVRGLLRLAQVAERFDRVIIECSGLADPAPIAQTFFTDDELRGTFRLESIVAVLDASQGTAGWKDSDVTVRQAAFADVILLNKTDLAAGADVDGLENHVRRTNRLARVYRTRHSNVHLGELVLSAGFSLTRAQELDPHFLQPEYPFRWAGVYPVGPEGAELWIEEGTLKETAVVVVPVRSTHGGTLADAKEAAALAFSDRGAPLTKDGGTIFPGASLHRLELTGRLNRFKIHTLTRGLHGIFLAHGPQHLRTTVHIDGIPAMPRWERTFHPRHSLPNAIESVGLRLAGTVDADRVRQWLQSLHDEMGDDLLRSKGVLTVQGTGQRLLVNGVKSVIEEYLDLAWKPTDVNANFIVLIGRNLDRTALMSGFRSCIAHEAVLEAQSA